MQGKARRQRVGVRVSVVIQGSNRNLLRLGDGGKECNDVCQCACTLDTVGSCSLSRTNAVSNSYQSFKELGTNNLAREPGRLYKQKQPSIVSISRWSLLLRHLWRLAP